ncbi:signal peptidase I [Haloferula luteola]|uniref:Signal peptidase I n=1 Tax=Haloferula luteola TaxID=595692 RepID=A0A840VJ41_9BACT|nr:signal peptidase I [Haloferula luteola]MBB5353880.1 signal peptidase I [Haloferula luteola]
MNPTTLNDSRTGRLSPRNPSTAANLSLFLPGLGQIYCGAFLRGMTHLCLFAAIVTAITLLVGLRMTSLVPLLLGLTIPIALLSLGSGWDARRLALSCRTDYRLKDYNRVWTYASLTCLTGVLAIGLAFSLRENYLHLFVMSGDSMSPTFKEGEMILVRKDAFRDRDPIRNELVAFLNPADRKNTLVKRVVGLPGETFEMRDGQVWIDGAPLENAATVATDHATIGPVVIPPNHCYVLGDHRQGSEDSRQIGPLPMIALVGKVVFSR